MIMPDFVQINWKPVSETNEKIIEPIYKILSILQKDCTLSTSDVAERVGLSTTPCWRRIQAMEKSGVIKGRVALADPEKLNVGLSIFVMAPILYSKSI